MALPTMTDEQRAEALAKAAAARKARSELLDSLKHGRTTVADILKRAKTDDVVSKTKVTAIVKALPGVGSARAAQIMADADIADNRRVGGLGERQRDALLAATAGRN